MPILSVDNISVSFGERKVLDNISFTINEGDKIAFIGNNGAGKSTLFKTIKGSSSTEIPSWDTSPRIWRSRTWREIP